MALFKDKTDQQSTMAKQVNGSSGPQQVNMVAEGTVFEGTLRADSDVRVSGRIEGKVIVEGRVIVAQEGSIDGELESTSADVAGEVKGALNIKERLVLRSSARIDGNIRTARLIVEEGATFDGDCEMGGQTRKKGESVPGVSAERGSEVKGSNGAVNTRVKEKAD